MTTTLSSMANKQEGKTIVCSVRLPTDLNERFTRIREEQAHKKVPSSELLLEAVKLYVELAEQYGINDDLRIKKTIGSYTPDVTKTGEQEAGKKNIKQISNGN